MTTMQERPAAAPAAPAATGGAPDGPAWHAMTPAEVLAAQAVTQEPGLSDAEVTSRRAKYGSNKFAEAAKEPAWRGFVRQYSDPMQIVLLVAGIVSLFLPALFATGIVLILLTVFNAFLGVSQEGKASASVAALQKMMVVQAKARRNWGLVLVPMGALVPGCVFNIEAVDLVPADGRII